MRKAFGIIIVILLWICSSDTLLHGATYNATGIWTASSYDNWVNSGTAGCEADPDRTITVIIKQGGDTVSFITDGILYTGTVSGNTYTATASRAFMGGTTTVTYQVTLTSATQGTGTTTWSWSDGSSYCNGGNHFLLTKNTSPVTYNTTGVWYFMKYDGWSSGCEADSPESGYTAITQNADTFTYTDRLGIHTGRIAGNEYYASLRYPEDGGYTTLIIQITLQSDAYGTGYETWSWSDGYYSCNGGNTFTLSKQSTDVTYDASGRWAYAAGEFSGRLSISQGGNDFRINGFNGTHRGLVSQDRYIAVSSYPENSGTMTESIVLTLSSDTAAVGAIKRYWTNGVIEEWNSQAFLMTKLSTDNVPPDRPHLSFPEDGAVQVSKTPVLKTLAFSDSNTGDQHSQTEWQISSSADFSSPVLVTTSETNLTSLSIPEFTLAAGKQYWWRTRFYDKSLQGSVLSSSRSFTVIDTADDTNGNGIPDDKENTNIDLDNDGISDNSQVDMIKSLETAVGKGQMGASRKGDPGISSIDSINSIDPDSISPIARPHTMPLGMVNLGLTVVQPADTVDVKIYFSQAAPENSSWYMYNSITGWKDYSAHGLAVFSTDRKSVTVRLKDWGYGDADGIPNGTILDPCGFGVASWIKGVVYDAATNKAVSTATIQVMDNDLKLSTVNEGNYVSMILPGTYTLSVSAPGYDDQVISDIEITEASIVTTDIQLTGGSKITGMETSGTFQVNHPVTFQVNAQSTSQAINYRYSIHPYYGTQGYDGKQWEGMTASEYISENSCTYTFDESGKYVVVVWATSVDPENVDPQGIPIIGWSVDTGSSGCRTNFTGITISGEQTVNETVTFTVAAENSCQKQQYYRFSMHPDYGTAGYDGKHWQTMTGTEWISENFIDYTFTASGKYIIVVWISDTVTHVDPGGIPIIGWSVDIQP